MVLQKQLWILLQCSIDIRKLKIKINFEKRYLKRGVEILD